VDEVNPVPLLEEVVESPLEGMLTLLREINCDSHLTGHEVEGKRRKGWKMKGEKGKEHKKGDRGWYSEREKQKQQQQSCKRLK